MSEEDIIMNMSEEMLRLKLELRKYKYTKEVPYSKATSDIKMEFYWDEGNDVRPPHPRVSFDPVGKTSTDMPLFKLVEFFVMSLDFLGDKQ